MKRIFALFVMLLALCADVFACTSAIVAAGRSSEGVPLLWKHRDNAKYTNTRVEYIDDATYAYTAVVPNSDRYAKGVYAGVNEKGFGVISTATKNLPEATPEEYKRTRRSHSNFGVGDATGAVAYFEVWDLGYRRYDVSESGNDGFDVRSNFSHAGDPEKVGASKRRYDLIMNEMAAHRGCFTPHDFIGYSRSYNSVKYGNVLELERKYYCSNHTVPRASTVGSFVVVCVSFLPGR